MANNKVVAAASVATAVLFLVVMMAEAQQMPPMPKFDPVCALANLPDTVQNCYFTLNLVPSEECCKDLKSASNMQVTCLCDNFIAHPSNANLTRARYDQVNLACDVLDKFACKAKGADANGGSSNKIAASMGLFGLVASLFF